MNGNSFSLFECAKLMLATRKWYQSKNTEAQSYCRQIIYNLYKLQSYQNVNPMWIFAVLEVYQLTHEHKYKIFARELLKSMPIFKNTSKNYLLLAAAYAKYFQIVGDERYLNLAKRSFRNAKQNSNNNSIFLVWLCLQLYEASYEEKYILELVASTNQLLQSKRGMVTKEKFDYFLYSLLFSAVYGKTLDNKYLKPIANCTFISLIKPESLIVFSLRNQKDKRKAINIAHGKFCPSVAIIIKTEASVDEQIYTLPFLINYPVIMGKNTYYLLNPLKYCSHTHDLFDVFDLL